MYCCCTFLHPYNRNFSEQCDTQCLMSFLIFLIHKQEYCKRDCITFIFFSHCWRCHKVDIYTSDILFCNAPHSLSVTPWFFLFLYVSFILFRCVFLFVNGWMSRITTSVCRKMSFYFNFFLFFRAPNHFLLQIYVEEWIMLYAVCVFKIGFFVNRKIIMVALIDKFSEK